MTMVSQSGLPLETLAEDIKARVRSGDRDAKRSEDHYKAAGIQLKEAKGRVESETQMFWLDWCASHFREIGGSRIEQLIRIGNGETTQAEINAASNRHRTGVSAEARAAAEDIMRRYGGESEQDPREADTRQRTSDAKAADAERKRRKRDEQRAARVAAGANLPPPLAPIEHRRLLNDAKVLLASLSFDDLKAAVGYLKGYQIDRAALAA